MKNYLEDLPRPFLALAPLYDVTDTVFRQVVASCGPPDLFFTEFVNADGLQSGGRDKIIHRLTYTEKEKPLIAQIWGKNPENFYKTAQDLVEMGFDGVDLNMGCPDKAVLKNGCCSALIKDHQLAGEIIEATKRGVAGRIPVSVKTRIGFREYNQQWLEFVLAQKIDMLSIHLRTVREMSKVPAHWELASAIGQLRDNISPSTLLVANGDVQSREQALELATEHGLDGVMIGRGVFANPFIFAEHSEWMSMPPNKKIEMYEKHVELFARTWKNGERPMITLNKFCKIYINGFDGAKEIRDRLMKTASIGELLQALNELKASNV